MLPVTLSALFHVKKHMLMQMSRHMSKNKGIDEVIRSQKRQLAIRNGNLQAGIHFEVPEDRHPSPRHPGLGSCFPARQIH